MRRTTEVALPEERMRALAGTARRREDVSGSVVLDRDAVENDAVEEGQRIPKGLIDLLTFEIRIGRIRLRYALGSIEVSAEIKIYRDFSSIFIRNVVQRRSACRTTPISAQKAAERTRQRYASNFADQPADRYGYGIMHGLDN